MAELSSGSLNQYPRVSLPMEEDKSLQSKLSYKSKLIGFIPRALEKIIYSNKLLFEDMGNEIDEFSDVKCIKILFSRDEHEEKTCPQLLS